MLGRLWESKDASRGSEKGIVKRTNFTRVTNYVFEWKCGFLGSPSPFETLWLAHPPTSRDHPIPRSCFIFRDGYRNSRPHMRTLQQTNKWKLFRYREQKNYQENVEIDVWDGWYLRPAVGGGVAT